MKRITVLCAAVTFSLSAIMGGQATMAQENDISPFGMAAMRLAMASMCRAKYADDAIFEAAWSAFDDANRNAGDATIDKAKMSQIRTEMLSTTKDDATIGPAICKGIREIYLPGQPLPAAYSK